MADHPAITCPKCEKKFKSKADVRGKRIRCPFCSEMFTVPEEADLTTAFQVKKDDDDAPLKMEPIQPRGEPQKPAGEPETLSLAPAEDDEWGPDNPYGVTELDIKPRCPNCANEMPSATAVVCLTCGYNTLTREWGKTEKTIGVSYGRHFVHLLPGLITLFLMIMCISERIFYSVVWPYIVAGTFLDWMDYEGLRMWGTLVSLSSIWALGFYTYRRFIVKPLPEEVKMD
jgi:hypothetical protein